MRGRPILYGCVTLGLGTLGLHAALVELARATGGAAALLAPSPAASISGLATALALLSARLLGLVVLPAVAAAFLGFFVASAVSAARRAGYFRKK